MKNLLFPKVFRTVGWLMFVPGLLAALLSYFSLISIPDIMETIVNDAIIISIILGSLFIVCSKIRQEDEMSRAIRLASLLNSFYAYVVIQIAGTIMINGVEYLKFMFFSILFLPVLTVFNFSAELYRYYKQSVDEESD